MQNPLQNLPRPKLFQHFIFIPKEQESHNIKSLNTNDALPPEEHLHRHHLSEGSLEASPGIWITQPDLRADPNCQVNKIKLPQILSQSGEQLRFHPPKAHNF